VRWPYRWPFFGGAKKDKNALGAGFQRAENGITWQQWLGLEHGKRFSRERQKRKTPQGMRQASERKAGTLRDRAPPSSFIRTMTVGSGIGPDLLTFRRSRKRSRACRYRSGTNSA
jgi:hypothetical protein